MKVWQWQDYAIKIFIYTNLRFEYSIGKGMNFYDFIKSCNKNFLPYISKNRGFIKEKEEIKEEIREKDGIF